MAADNAKMQLMIPHCRQREEQEGERRGGRRKRGRRRNGGKRVCRAGNQTAVQICTFNCRLYANIGLDTFTWLSGCRDERAQPMSAHVVTSHFKDADAVITQGLTSSKWWRLRRRNTPHTPGTRDPQSLWSRLLAWSLLWKSAVSQIDLPG